MPRHAPPTRRSLFRRSCAIAGTAVVTLTGGVLAALSQPSAGATEASGLTAVYHTTASWGTGYQAQVVLDNTGASAVSGWQLMLNLPSGQHITSLWEGSPSATTGTVVITPRSWNDTIDPGATLSVGYVASANGLTRPAGCAINGLACSGLTAAPSSPAPASASATDSPSTTPTSTTPTAAPTTSTTSAPTAPSTTPPAPGPGIGRFSPYADATLGNFDLTAMSSAAGAKTITMAFIVADAGCTPAWGGVQPVSGKPFLADIAALRAAGGDVRISFGGQAGQELAQVCTSATALADAYQTVIETYSARAVDFDVEGAAVADPASIDLRNAAIAILEQRAAAAGHALEVSYTLPVLPQGLTADGVHVLRNAAAHGVRVAAVNIMAMDYGDWAAPAPAGQMGSYAIQAATSTMAQVRQVWPSYSDAQAWAHVAVTPMIGVNDTSDEVFSLSDARQLVSFAQSKHLAWLAFWSLGRDRQCSGGAKDYADPTCSSIVQTPYAFSAAFAKYS